MSSLDTVSTILSLGFVYTIYMLITLLRGAYETIDKLKEENQQLKDAAKVVNDYEEVAVINAKN